MNFSSCTKENLTQRRKIHAKNNLPIKDYFFYCYYTFHENCTHIRKTVALIIFMSETTLEHPHRSNDNNKLVFRV